MKGLDKASTARVLTAVLTTACLAAAIFAPAAGASVALAPGSRYLALGDSVTFGYQEPSVVPKPNYRDAASFPGYPEQLGAELHLNVANAACPGETSASLIDPLAISNGCENTIGAAGGYRRAFPLHVKYSGSQLAFAVSYLKAHRDTRLVSLMIGANDLFVCQETTKDHCLAKAEYQPALQKVAHNVHTILSAIRTQAGYRGELVIVNYYALNYSSALVRGESQTLNGAVTGAARRFNVRIADAYGEFAAASRRSGGSSCTAGLLTQLGTPSKCGVHPSYAGQALLAQAVLKAVTL